MYTNLEISILHFKSFLNAPFLFISKYLYVNNCIFRTKQIEVGKFSSKTTIISFGRWIVLCWVYQRSSIFGQVIFHFVQHQIVLFNLLFKFDKLYMYVTFLYANLIVFRYGIALDGQRGNRLHIFTQEELLTQAVSFLKFYNLFCLVKN